MTSFHSNICYFFLILVVHKIFLIFCRRNNMFPKVKRFTYDTQYKKKKITTVAMEISNPESDFFYLIQINYFSYSIFVIASKSKSID